MSLAYYDHSCYPNCAMILDGLKASLKVIREFSLDEEEVDTIIIIFIYEQIYLNKI